MRSIEDSVARLQADGDLKLNLDLSVDESKEDKPQDSTQTFNL